VLLAIGGSGLAGRRCQDEDDEIKTRGVYSMCCCGWCGSVEQNGFFDMDGLLSKDHHCI
jgi:hypothetical protein